MLTLHFSKGSILGLLICHSLYQIDLNGLVGAFEISGLLEENRVSTVGNMNSGFGSATVHLCTLLH